MRLAGSPVAHTGPLSSGTDWGEFPSGGLGRSTERPLGPRTKDKETKDQGLYHNYRFLGDHTPGGGIDLRASGCALCVCLPLTLLYSYSQWIDPRLATSWGRPGEELLKLKPVEWIQPLRWCLLCTAFRRAQDRTTSKGWQPRRYDFAPPLRKCRPRRTAQTPLRFLLQNRWIPFKSERFFHVMERLLEQWMSTTPLLARCQNRDRSWPRL